MTCRYLMLNYPCSYTIYIEANTRLYTTENVRDSLTRYRVTVLMITVINPRSRMQISWIFIGLSNSPIFSNLKKSLIFKDQNSVFSDVFIRNAFLSSNKYEKNMKFQIRVIKKSYSIHQTPIWCGLTGTTGLGWCKFKIPPNNWISSFNQSCNNTDHEPSIYAHNR